MIVVIDGPAGSGKSSTAKAAADKLGIEYLDSGALYRALTIVYIDSGKHTGTFFKLLNEQTITFNYVDGMFYVHINGTDVTEQLRSAEVAGLVSEVAAMPEARAYVNDLMLAAVKHGRYIAEGRDLGTAVFPDADLKFFMSADMDRRVQRRYEQLRKQDDKITREKVRQNIVQRDRKDEQRKTDPLRKADDAIEIDTTNMSFEQQVNKICSKISEVIEIKSGNNQNH